MSIKLEILVLRSCSVYFKKAIVSADGIGDGMNKKTNLLLRLSLDTIGKHNLKEFLRPCIVIYLLVK